MREPIGKVCKFEKGKKPKNTGIKSDIRTIPYINIKAFETGIPQEYAEPGNYPMCSKNDVLIVWDGARAGLVGKGVSGYIGSTLSKVWSDKTDNKYLFYFLKFKYDYINTHTKGVGIPHVDPNILNAIEIPIASPILQSLIIAEIEKQFSRLDEAVAALKRIKANLKRYKASVLKAAVEGKLTEEWRLSARLRAQVEELNNIPKAQNNKWVIYIIECDNGSFYVGHTSDLHARWKAHCEGKGSDWTKTYMPKYLIHFEEYENKDEVVKREKDLKTGYGRTWRKREIDAGRMKPLVHNSDNETALPVHGVQTGSELLKRILAERRKRWEKEHPGKKYKEPASPDTSNLPELPKGWVWATVEQVADAIDPQPSHRTPPETETGVSYIGMGDIDKYGKIDFNRARKVSDKVLEEHKHRYRLKVGDFIFGKIGTIGKPVNLYPPFNYALSANIVLIQPHVSIILPAFCFSYIDSPLMDRVIRKESRATTQSAFGIQKVRIIPIPLPPLSEQQTIIEEVERRLSVTEEIEAEIEINLKRAERLRQSILKKAFTGRLIPQRAAYSNINIKGDM